MDESGQKLEVTAVHSNRRRAFDPVSRARLIAACCEPGASVSKLALEHGVNANLLWKWIRKYGAARKEALPIAPLTPAFIPVQIECGSDRAVSKQGSDAVPDLAFNHGGVRRLAPEKTDQLSRPAKVNVSLPNGVTLSVECGDVRAVTAIIGALSDVQTGR